MRVLQVLGGTSLGGAESRVMDSYRHMDRNRIQFDFAVHTGEKGFFDEEIERLGGFFQGTSRLQGSARTYDKHGVHLSADRKEIRRAADDCPCKERWSGSGA